MAVSVRPYDARTDERWASDFLHAALGGRRQARRGELVDVLAPGTGLIAEQDGRRVGLLAYRLEDGVAELSALGAERPGRGIGTSLVEALWPILERAGCRRVWVVTTNDNLDAVGFYQRRGFRLSALRAGAVDAARRDLKPEIPPVGASGIPMRDEIELERTLDRVDDAVG